MFYADYYIKFPRIIIPASSTFAGILDYAIASVVMLGMMLYYHYPITPALLLVPVVLGVTWMLAVGTSLWLSALNVEYKDIRHALPFFVQIWFFISPVCTISKRWKNLRRYPVIFCHSER